MIDRKTSVSVMTDTHKEKIKEYYGIDVDSDLLSDIQGILKPRYIWRKI